MASDQVSRIENTTTERDIYLEKDRVPKMTTHFESLAEKARQSDVAAGVGNGKGKQTPHEKTGNTVAHGYLADQNARERHEFESLAGKVGEMNVSAVIVAKTEEGKEGDQARKGRESQLEERTREPYAMRKFEASAGQDECKGKDESHNKEEKGSSMEMAGKEGNTGDEKDKGAKLVGREEEGEKPEQLSLEEISKLRASAQQNAAETIRAAEARYNKSKELAGQALNNAAEYAKEKGAQAKESVLQSAQYATDKGEKAKDSVRQSAQQVAEKGAKAKDSVVQGTQHAAVKAKDTILEGAKKTSQYISEKGSETKETAAEKIRDGHAATKGTLVSAGKATVDYTVPKVEQAKDYALEKAAQAKDNAVDTSKNIARYAGEKAIATKDVTIEKGKEAVELADKVAVDSKDKAIAAGWSAAHYTTEKAVEGTKAAARMVEEAAKYAGHKSMQIAAKPLGAAKNAAAAAGETMKEYTSRKKEEAEREIEAKRFRETQGDNSSYQEEENKRGPSESQEREDLSKKVKEKSVEASKTTGNVMNNTFQGSSEPIGSGERQRRQDGDVEEEGMQQTGVLDAIGETIVEIAQTTKEFVIGPDQPKTQSADSRG